MMLRRLELQAFGRFRDEIVEFAPGMNLVSGPNDSGKTTLVQAVTAVLFGAGQVARFVPWEDAARCRAALVWTSDDGQVRIERDFLSGQVICSETDEAGAFQSVFCGFPQSEHAVADRAAYLSYLQNLLGVSRKDLFQALLYGDSLEGTAGVSPEGLKACLYGGETAAFNETLDQLQSECLEISSVNPWGLQVEEPGVLEKIAQRLGALEQEWFSVHETICQWDGCDVVSVAENVAEEEAASDRQTMAAVAEETRPDGQAAEEEQTPADAIDGHGAEPDEHRAELEAELAKTGLPRKIPEQLPELLFSYGELRQAMAEHKRALGARQEERRRSGMPAWQKPLWILVALWAVVWIWSRTQSSFMPVWGGLLVSAVGAGWYAWCCLQARGAGRALDTQIAGLEEQVGGLQEQLAELNERLETLGLSPSPVEMVRMQKNLSRHLRILEQLEQCEQVACEESETSVSLSATDMMEAPPVAEDPSAAGADTRTADVLPDDDGEQGEQRNPADRSPLPETGSIEELLDLRTRIETEGEVLRAREARLKARAETLQTACSLLRDTLADCSGSDLQTFTRILEHTVNGLTGGAVEKVHITECFNVELPGPDGAWRPVEHFSSAIRMLVQMALCLSLNQVRGEAARLPMLLDDPMGSFDRKRRGQVMKILEECAAGQQVILFSHEEALRRRAMREGWHLISLRTAGPSVAASNEEKNVDDGQLSFL